MKTKIKKQFFEKYKNKEINKEIIINFLKEEEEYDEEYEDIQIEEIEEFINLNKENKEKKEENKKDTYNVYNIRDNEEIKKEIKNNIKIKYDNIEEIRSNFDYMKTSIENFGNINILNYIDIYIDYDIKCTRGYKNYKLFLIFGKNVYYADIYTIIGIIYNISTFKHQLKKLKEIFGWEYYEKQYKEYIINKNNKNIKFLDEKIGKKLSKRLKKYKDIIKIIIKLENKLYNDMNRTKSGYSYIFISKNKIAEYGFSRTKVGDCINLLSYIGFIEKVDYNNELTLEADIRINKNNKHNKVNIIKINDFTSKEYCAIKKIKYLEENKLLDRDIKKKNIEKYKDFARVFPEKNKNKKLYK